MVARFPFATADVSAFGNLQHQLEATHSALPRTWLTFEQHTDTYTIPNEYSSTLFLERFGRLIGAYTHLYSTCVGPNSDSGLIKWLSKHVHMFLKVREFHRWLSYRNDDIPYWSNKLRFMIPKYRNFDPKARLYIATRINWVQTHTDNSKDPYTATNRYELGRRSSATIRAQLDDDHQHILDFTSILPVELHVLATAAFHTENILHRLESLIYKVRSLALTKTTTVQHIAYPVEVDSPPTPEDKDSCSICSQPFNDEKPASRLESCGHIVGTDCLQTWINTNGDCPVCHATLYNKHWTRDDEEAHNEDMKYFRAAFRALDKDIDELLTEEPKEIYGEKMKAVIDKIAEHVFWPVEEQVTKLKKRFRLMEQDG